MSNYIWFGQWVSGTTYPINAFVKNNNICFVSTTEFYSVLPPDTDLGNWNVFIIGLTGTTVTPTPTNTVTPTITSSVTPTPTPTPTSSESFFILAQNGEILTAEDGSGIEFQH